MFGALFFYDVTVTYKDTFSKKHLCLHRRFESIRFSEVTVTFSLLPEKELLISRSNQFKGNLEEISN